MPFTGPEDPNLPANVQSRDEAIRAQWVEVFNSVFRRCILINRDKLACESDAFKQANGVIKMAELQTRDISNVEILRTGKWHGQGCPEKGCEFTDADLDAMVSTYRETRGAFEPPVKLGHNERQRLLGEDGLPNAGLVSNIRRDGEFLLADLKEVPEKVAELLEAGAFKGRSAEILRDHAIGEKKYPWAFVGLALLGETMPAVTGLNDITKLYQGMQLELDEKAAIVIFEDEVSLAESDVNALLSEFDRTAGSIQSLVKNRRGAPTIRELARAFKEGVKRAIKGEPQKFADPEKDKEVDVALAQEIRKLLGLAEDADVVEAVKLLNEKASKPEAEDGKGDVQQLRADLDDSQKAVVTLQRESETRKAEALVDGLIQTTQLLPAQREVALAMALRDHDGAKAFFESQPKGIVALGETGSASDETIAGLEPTPEQVQIAKDMDVWTPEHRLQLMRDNAEAKGIELPADFGKPAKKEDVGD